MKEFWQRRVPALLLTVLMLVGTAIPVTAGEDPVSTGGSTSSSSSSSSSSSEATDPTHTHIAGKQWNADSNGHFHTCTVCGAEMDRSPHIEPGDWNKKDVNYHYKVCTECGFELERAGHDFGDPVITESTCSQKGTKVYTCKDCGYVKTEIIDTLAAHTPSDSWSYDTTSHWRICSVCKQEISGTRAAHTYDSSYTSDASYHWRTCTICKGTSAKGVHVDKNNDGVCDICGRGGLPTAAKYTVTFINSGSTFATQSINKGACPTNPGTPSKTASNCSFSFKGWTTSNPGTTAIYTGQSVLSSAQVAQTSVTANVTYYAVYSLTALNQNASVDVTGTGDVTIGTEVRTKLNSMFSSVSGRSFTTVSFSSVSNSSYGTLYANSGKTSLTGRTYSYSGGTYPVTGLYFVPSGTRGTYSVTYSAADGYGNTVRGTLSINTTAAATSTRIAYTVRPGQTVSLSRSDFNRVFQTGYSETVRWVEFTSVGSFSTSDGVFYYNYGNSSQREFSRTTLDDYAYYYSDSGYGTYSIGDMSFVAASGASNKTISISFRAYYSSNRYVNGTMEIQISGTSVSTGITYTVRPGQKVSLDRSDFNRVFRTEYSDTVRWVEFTSVGSFSSSDGAFYYNYGKSNQQEFSRTTVDDYAYYYSDSSFGAYPIDDMSFVAAGGASKKTISVSFRAYYSNSRYVNGTMEIQIDGSASSITYQVNQGEEVEFSRGDFSRMFQNSYSGYDLRYVSFMSSSSYDTSDGTFYYDYGGRNERAFTRGNLTSYTYYYSGSSYGDYALDDLSFVASSSFSGSMTLSFRAYYDSSHYVDGTLVIEVKETVNRGDVRYYTTGSTNVQINPNDIARFLKKTYSGTTLQSVKLNGVPETGTLYYNYYGVSSYGVSSLRLTSSNCDDQLLYFSPSGTNQYALSELTYVPSGSNYCVTIPFTAYGTSSRSVQGNILISVNSVTVQDVYGATPANTSVTFPASAIYSAVATAVASKASLSSIQLLELPASSKGTIYAGTGSVKANTSTRYTYSGSSGSGRISDLRFAPASGFTGSVEIPYVAYNSSDQAIASGRLCLGIVGSLKSYRDVSSSVWCYKYVAELSDGKVIDGYPDGYFRPDKTVTYGQALKLIMLAANYSTQTPTGKHPFSGYLTRAKADGLLTGVKDSDLDRPISRLAVAQITARAMRLALSNLSSVKPFTDTSDVYVQALSAAGIVEGYFSNGTSTFKPSNTMTRGQISAIVWRMKRAE